jgi:hypothetical protein
MLNELINYEDGIRIFTTRENIEEDWAIVLYIPWESEDMIFTTYFLPRKMQMENSLLTKYPERIRFICVIDEDVTFWQPTGDYKISSIFRRRGHAIHIYDRKNGEIIGRENLKTARSTYLSKEEAEEARISIRKYLFKTHGQDQVDIQNIIEKILKIKNG